MNEFTCPFKRQDIWAQEQHLHLYFRHDIFNNTQLTSLTTNGKKKNIKVLHSSCVTTTQPQW
jgi:hypothetical protein